jgi:putative ABC transport system permease protein
MLSAMLLNIGLVMQFRLGDFFSIRAYELNSAHGASLVVPMEYAQARYEFTRSFEGAEDAEFSQSLFGTGTITINNTARIGTWIIVPYNAEQRLNPPRLIGDGLPLTGNAIYVPYFMTLDGVQLGDEVTISLDGGEISFTLAGGTEEILFGAMMQTTWRFYVPQARFYELLQAFPDREAGFITVRMENEGDEWRFISDYALEFAGQNMWMTSIANARSARITVPTIAGVIIAVFSLIMLVVGVIVIRFRIIVGIEESMLNIGVLKAMGYSSGQIISSVIVQYGGIALIGGFFGILVSQAVFPVVISVIQPFFALPWRPMFDLPVMAASLGGITLASVLFSYISARCVIRLHPLVALRGGISTHNFKKNPCELEKSRGPLVLILALKNVLMNKKQAAMICLIIFAVTFTAVSGVTAHYNINVNRVEFLRTVNGEMADVMFTLSDESYAEEFRRRMETRPQVERMFRGGFQITVIVNDFRVVMAIVDDFEFLAGYDLVSGRFPRHYNEIALGASMMDVMGVSIGDWVTVENFAYESAAEFLVTGSTQAMIHQGKMTSEALSRTGVYVGLVWVNVQLASGTDAEEFAAVVLSEESDIVIDAQNMQELIDGIFAPVGAVFAAVTAVVLAAVAAVVMLVLYIVIKTAIVRRRRELGLQKALGFTTLQLMNQIALGLAPAVVLGAAVGSAAGYLGFDAVFVALLRGMGIARVNLPAPLDWTILVFAALIFFAYVISMLVAWRIRKISAYALTVSQE